jgi:hypothetical protein
MRVNTKRLGVVAAATTMALALGLGTVGCSTSTTRSAAEDDTAQAQEPAALKNVNFKITNNSAAPVKVTTDQAGSKAQTLSHGQSMYDRGPGPLTTFVTFEQGGGISPLVVSALNPLLGKPSITVAVPNTNEADQWHLNEGDTEDVGAFGHKFKVHRGPDGNYKDMYITINS